MKQIQADNKSAERQSAENHDAEKPKCRKNKEYNKKAPIYKKYQITLSIE